MKLFFRIFSDPMKVGASLLPWALAGQLSCLHAATPENTPQSLAHIDGVDVSVRDVLEELRLAPPGVKESVLENPASLQRLAGKVYLQRQASQEALRQGLDQHPEAKIRLQIARERALSEWYIQHLAEAKLPTDAVLEQLAKDRYQAEPGKFRQPEQVKVRHILVAKATENAAAVAQEILDQLKAGADFEKLAREKSNDTGSASKGGDLGYFSKGRMVKPFEDAAFQLANAGDLSPIVETNFGFHIIQLQDKRAARMPPFEEIRDTLKADIRARLLTDAKLAYAQPIQDGIPKLNPGAVEALKKAAGMPSKAMP